MDKSTHHLHNTMHPLALSSVQKSDHKQRFQETKTSSTPQYTKPYRGCRRASHPRGSMSKKVCLAVRLVCHNCRWMGHLKVCQKVVTSRKEATNRTSRSEESVIFTNNTPHHHPTYTDCICDSMQSIAKPHLVWNREQFQRSSPEPSPSVTVKITMIPRTHVAFDCIPMNTVSHQSHHILAFADTRAQTCSSGPEIQRLLGYSDRYLVPTTHQICGITNNWLHVKGLLFLHVRVASRETWQAVCVANNTSSLYLLQIALKDLNLLPLDFPTPASHNNS